MLATRNENAQPGRGSRLPRAATWGGAQGPAESQGGSTHTTASPAHRGPTGARGGCAPGRGQGLGEPAKLTAAQRLRGRSPFCESDNKTRSRWPPSPGRRPGEVGAGGGSPTGLGQDPQAGPPAGSQAGGGGPLQGRLPGRAGIAGPEKLHPQIDPGVSHGREGQGVGSGGVEVGAHLHRDPGDPGRPRSPLPCSCGPAGQLQCSYPHPHPQPLGGEEQALEGRAQPEATGWKVGLQG